MGVLLISRKNVFSTTRVNDLPRIKKSVPCCSMCPHVVCSLHTLRTVFLFMKLTSLRLVFMFFSPPDKVCSDSFSISLLPKYRWAWVLDGYFLCYRDGWVSICCKNVVFEAVWLKIN